MGKKAIENDNSIKKPRKRRKPMSEEQKKAAVERLAIAREKRLKENPPEYKSIHPSVLERPEDDAWHHTKIKQWIKTQKGLLATERANVRAKIKGAEAKLATHQGYIRNLETYLRTGDYVDMFWGEYQQNRCKQICIVMAYHADGTPKRSVGVWYPDIGEEWTKEMDAVFRGENKNRGRK